MIPKNFNINIIKNKKAITIISLTITIVILIFLTGIVINATIGENGLFKSAKKTKDNMNNILNREESKIDDLYSQLQVSADGTITVNANTLKEIIQGEIDNAVEEKELVSQTQVSNTISTSISNNNLNKIYPVGSIFISTSSTNPGTYFGGTWQAYGQGRTLVGVGTGTDTRNESKTFNANSTGGEYNHVLTTAEMATHSHTRGTMEITGEALLSTTETGYETVVTASGAFSTTTEYVRNDGNSQNRDFLTKEASNVYRDNITMRASNSWTGATSEVGNSQAHNNIQPYITTYMWKRTN